MITNLPLNGKFEITAAFMDINPKLWKDGHKGIDFVRKTTILGSDTIYATCNSTVAFIGNDPQGWGLYVSLNDDEYPNRKHLFCHLASINVKVGDKVTRLTKLGVMGSSGNSTSKHLHYQINDLINGKWVAVDPSEHLGIPNKRGLYLSSDYAIDETNYGVLVKGFKTVKDANAYAQKVKDLGLDSEVKTL